MALEDPLRRARGIKTSLEKKEESLKKNENHQGLAESIVTKAGQYMLYGY